MSSPRPATPSSSDDEIFSIEDWRQDDDIEDAITGLKLAMSPEDSYEASAKQLRQSGFMSRSISSTAGSSIAATPDDSEEEDDLVAKSFELTSKSYQPHTALVNLDTPAFLSTSLLSPTKKKKTRPANPSLGKRESRLELFAGSHVASSSHIDVIDNADETIIPLAGYASGDVEITMPSSCSATGATIDTLTWIAAAVTATPTALYAAFGTTSPGDVNKDWWEKKSTVEKILTGTYGLSSEAVNTIMSALFLPTAAKGLLNGIKTFKQYPIRFIAANVGGIASAFSSFALAYSPFKPFIGSAGATTFAGFNALVAYTQRFVGTESIFKRINTTFFNKESALQQDVLEKLSRLKDEYLTNIQEIIENNNRNEQDFSPEKQDEVMQKLFRALALKLDELHQENAEAMTDSPRSTYTFKYLMLAGDLLFATAMAAAVFCSFAQKGFQAFDNIEKLVTHNIGHIFTDLHPGLKILLSFLPGMVSAAFYFINSFDLRKTAVHVFNEMYNSYQEGRYKDLTFQVLKVATVFVLNGLASKSMLGVGASVANNPNNLFGIPATSTSIGMLYAIANQIAGGVVNVKATLVKTFPVEAPQITKEFGSDEEALKRFLAKFAAYFSDASAHPISSENVRVISQLSLFGGRTDRSQLLEEEQDIEAGIPSINIRASSIINIDDIPNQYENTEDSSYIGSLGMT